MKSNTALIGAKALTALLEELEQLAASGTTDGAAAEKAADGGARYRRLMADLAADPE
jgi:hypothetical protein